MENVMTMTNGFAELSSMEMYAVDGGVSGGDVASVIAGAYSTAVGIGATYGTGMVLVVCTNPIVAGTAAVAGVASIAYGVYTLFR